MSDLIERQKAIDVLMEFDKKLRKINWYQYPHTEYECRGVDEAIVKIENVPSAHPETEERKEESAQNVPKEDLISRKEAIDYCYQLINVEHQQGSDEMNYGQERVNQTEAILHHLEFMPSAQPEPCDDAVSRDSVKFLLCKETCHPGAFCPDGFCREICEKVDALPSATPKQRMGVWIEQEDAWGVYYECSVCKEPFTFISTPSENLYNFCPNCGSYNGGDNDDQSK